MEDKVSGGACLRIKCLIIGYLNLVQSAKEIVRQGRLKPIQFSQVATVVDIVFHVLITAIVSNGFQCDVDEASLSLVDWPWLEPLLLILNIGTHGFYALPMTLRTNGHYAEHMPLPQYPRCYPGHIHVYQIDVLAFFINMVWLKFVMAFIGAAHKRQPEPMRIFFDVSIVKLILQIMFFAYEPTIQNTFSVETFSFMKLFDICITTGLLFIIKSYINEERKCLRAAQNGLIHVEYLISARKPLDTNPEKKECLDDVTVACEKSDKPAEITHEVYR